MITQPPSLVTVLRQLPYLAPEDSAGRAVDLLRHGGIDTLPVVNARGRLVGLLSIADLRPLLGHPGRDDALLGPIAPWVRQPTRLGAPGMSVAEVEGILANSGETTLFVVDRDGRYLGGVSLADLLVPLPIRPRPPSVGGMATPWGVYLTSGTLQAGSSNVMLALGGGVMGVLLASSNTAVALLAWAAQQAGLGRTYALWNAVQPSLSLGSLGWYALHALVLPVFLLFIRLLPLTGYHAAEHQAVHTMERGEPLHVDVARRMPRVHPRCGTNLMAAGLLFGLVSQALPALKLGFDATDSAVLGALVALFTWRSVGALMQQYLTTRPATDRQLAAGLAAAADLEQRYLFSAPRRPTLWRRLWCSGMLQTAAGIAAGTAATLALSDAIFRFIH